MAASLQRGIVVTRSSEPRSRARRVVDEAADPTHYARARREEGEALQERIHWWWAGIVDWLRNRPYAWREARREAAERLQRTWWRLGAGLLDVAHVVRGRVARRPLRERTAREPRPAAAFALPGFEREVRVEPELGVMTLRIAALAEEEQLLEVRRSRLATLEQWLTHRQGELRTREADLDELRERAQAQAEWRRLELELREQELRSLGQARQQEADARPHTPANEPDSAPPSSEPDVGEDLPRTVQVVTTAPAIRARRRFDPEVASALRRARHERRS